MHEVSRALLYGLLAAASPVTLLAAFASLGTGRGRATGLAFTGAFVLGQSLAYLVVWFVGSAIAEDQTHSTATAVLEVGLGAVLLVIALRERSRGAASDKRTARTKALFARLERTEPAVAFGFGLPLGIGAKRLAITILAAGSVSVAGLGRAANITLGLLYVVVATMLVWIPVALYLILGRRADASIAHARAWVVTHERQLTYFTALAFGILLVLDGLVHLLV